MALSTEQPTLRRDAARNRDKIVAAAREAFADHGVDVGVDVIADQAGVGVGTLYRRFPTKESLIDAIIDELFEQVSGLAHDSLDAEPPESGFAGYLHGVGQLQVDHIGCLSRLWNHTGHAEARKELEATVRQLLHRAQDAGLVRRDVAYPDISVILWSLRGVIEATAPVAPNQWQRYLDLVLAGLRPSDQPLSRPALTGPQVDRVFAIHRLRARGARSS
jgi:AcrR family transcriptional regulator